MHLPTADIWLPISPLPVSVKKAGHNAREKLDVSNSLTEPATTHIELPDTCRVACNAASFSIYDELKKNQIKPPEDSVGETGH